MIDLLGLLEKFGEPAAGALAGWLGKSITLSKRVESIEKKVEDELSDVQTRVEALEKRINASVARDELERNLRSLRSEVKAVERRLRESESLFAKDSEFTKFVTEENERWQRMERALGKIEGLLEREGVFSRMSKT
jgi:septal ring factor EnvC (AmiA/AmiB activator)